MCVNALKKASKVQKSLQKARIILLNYFKGNQHRGGNDKENRSLDDFILSVYLLPVSEMIVLVLLENR